MIPRRPSTNPKRHKTWACPCGAKLGLDVTRTEHDEDGLILRIRVCRNCGEPMATEERPIPYSSFFPRANSHSKRQTDLYHRKRRTCQWCGHTYRGGTYSKHVRKPEHLEKLSTAPTAVERRKQRERATKRYWAERGFTHLEKAS